MRLRMHAPCHRPCVMDAEVELPYRLANGVQGTVVKGVAPWQLEGGDDVAVSGLDSISRMIVTRTVRAKQQDMGVMLGAEALVTRTFPLTVIAKYACPLVAPFAGLLLHTGLSWGKPACCRVCRMCVLAAAASMRVLPEPANVSAPRTHHLPQLDTLTIR